MELREFVAEALTQIVKGVKEAQVRAKDHGARVNPHLSTSGELAAKHSILIASGSAAQLVQFDVALTAKEGTGTKGGIGVVAGVFALGSTGPVSGRELFSEQSQNFLCLSFYRIFLEPCSIRPP